MNIVKYCQSVASKSLLICPGGIQGPKAWGWVQEPHNYALGKKTHDVVPLWLEELVMQ